MRRLFVAVSLAVACFVYSASAFAEEWEKYDKPVPTRVVVRVLSHGAKAMSPHTRAVIRIKDAETGVDLTGGEVEGSTGDTTALTGVGYPRITGQTGMVKGSTGALLQGAGFSVYQSGEDAAKFEAVINISKPTLILVEAIGPLNPKHSKANAVATTWVFPGEDITGEGIVLELRGLIVDVDNSLRDKTVKVSDAADGITVPFAMRMMCGCPIAPAGSGIPWEAGWFNITTQAYYNGKLYYEDTKTSDKLFKGVSQFAATVPLPKDIPSGGFGKERLKVRVMAAQPKLANYGMDEFNVYLSR